MLSRTRDVGIQTVVTPGVTCPVYQSETRTMEYILSPRSWSWPSSATTSATLGTSSQCPWSWDLDAEKMNEQHLHGLTTQEDKNMSSDAVRKISGGKPHSIEFCFPVNWISQNFFSPVRKVISLWDLKITFILIKCISCTGNQFTLSLTNKKGDLQKDRPSKVHYCK